MTLTLTAAHRGHKAALMQSHQPAEGHIRHGQILLLAASGILVCVVAGACHAKARKMTAIQAMQQFVADINENFGDARLTVGATVVVRTGAVRNTGAPRRATPANSERGAPGCSPTHGTGAR